MKMKLKITCFELLLLNKYMEEELSMWLTSYPCLFHVCHCGIDDPKILSNKGIVRF